MDYTGFILFKETGYVGSGAFGDVFKCRWGADSPLPENTQPVAVKVMRLPNVVR